MTQKINWTTQRKVIYELVQAANDHPTAQDIMDRLRDQGYQFAYGTVYNSLHYLVESGLIVELKLGDSVSRYDGRTEDHLHIICDRCGKVAEAHVDLPAEWTAALGAKTDFTIHKSDIVFHGLCSDCSSGKADAAALPQ